MIDRNIKEPLNLRLVQIHREHPVRARRTQQVRHELGRNRHAWLVLAVLPRVPVIRNHRGDARRRRPPERVDHHQQFHDVLIDGRARRLDDEHVGPADVLVDLKRDLAVGEPAQPRLPDLNAEKLGDLLRQGLMGAAGKHLQIAEAGRRQAFTTQRSSHRWVVCTKPPATTLPSGAGWGGRIRTFEYGIQSPAPYRLATPHHSRRDDGIPQKPSARVAQTDSLVEGSFTHKLWAIDDLPAILYLKDSDHDSIRCVHGSGVDDPIVIRSFSNAHIINHRSSMTWAG